MATWLVDESKPLDDAAKASIQAALRFAGRETRGPRGGAALAVRLNDVVIHDVKKWFGGADIRIDVMAVTGPSEASVPAYQPTTFRFPGVRDGDRLPIESPGLIVYYGHSLHFLDMSIVVSRDRKDTSDLATLIAERVNSPQWAAAAATLVGLAVAAPQAAVVTGAIAAAATIGNFASDVLQQVTGATVGLYRASWLQSRDRFGLGRHPETGAFRQKDLEFWFEIVADRR
jgi:hypothetical protein